MRRITRYALVCLLALLPCAAFASAGDDAKTAMRAYEEVLSGNRSYVQCGENGNGEGYFAGSVSVWDGYESNAAFTYKRFCVTDLDADDSPETLLELWDSEGYPFGYELLRFENGAVNGYCFVLRALEEITLEGDVYASDGAGDNGWYTLFFQGADVQRIETCRMQSVNGYEQYFIGENEVTESEYLRFTGEIESRKRPTWFDFTAGNVAYVVSQFR